MPTTIPSITSSTRPGSPSTGDAYYETDTKSYIIYDGAAWRGFVSDGETLGANGYSLDLDGTDDRVELGNIATLNSASAFSLSFWVKLSSSAPSPSYLYQSGSDTFYNTISFYQSTYMDFLLGTGSNYAGTRYESNIRDDQWHHLAGVYNGSTAVIYVDGVTPSQIGIGLSIPSSTLSTAGNSPHIGSKTDNSAALEGKMDDFSIFNAALTSTEVSNIYNSRLYNPTTLIHQYRFENNYNDSKGSLNGTAQGNPTFDSSDKPY